MKHIIPRFRPALTWAGMKAFCAVAVSSQKSGEETGRPVFETAFAQYIGARHAIATPSGRAGLAMILKNSGCVPGDEILVPAFTYWAVPAVIEALGLQPVFVDIDPATCHLDTRLIPGKITRKTRAIIPTHLYGLPCDMRAVREIASRHRLRVFEDCVQACGAFSGGKRAGSLGDAAYFSFGITKNMTLLGGGMITTDDDMLAEGIRREAARYPCLSRLGLLKKTAEALLIISLVSPLVFPWSVFPWVRLGHLFGRDLVGLLFERTGKAKGKKTGSRERRMPSFFQNAFGPAALADLEINLKCRIHHGRAYLRYLRADGEIKLPPAADNHIFTSFPIRSEMRDKIARALSSRGIDTSVGFMQSFGGDCPRAAQLEREILHLPVHPFLKSEELIYICTSLNEVLERL